MWPQKSVCNLNKFEKEPVMIYFLKRVTALSLSYLCLG